MTSLDAGLWPANGPWAIAATSSDADWRLAAATLADLAVAAGAPAVAVTGPGSDAVNHTTLALGALGGHGIAASVVLIGDVNESDLPVTPAGRIPGGLPDDFAGAAAGWLDPILRAHGTPPPMPPAAPAPTRPRATVSGSRVVLALVAVFVVLVAVVCGLAWSQRTEAPTTSQGLGEQWWAQAYVPFAATGDGGSLLTDQRPGGHGRVGEFYAEDGTSFERWPASYAELLEGTAGALETGRVYLGRYRAAVADGLLDWEIV